MARETKVGMVAGLAFIICFAVILANRGRSTALSHTPPVLLDRGMESTWFDGGKELRPSAQRTGTGTPAHGDAGPSSKDNRAPVLTSSVPPSRDVHSGHPAGGAEVLPTVVLGTGRSIPDEAGEPQLVLRSESRAAGQRIPSGPSTSTGVGESNPAVERRLALQRKLEELASNRAPNSPPIGERKIVGSAESVQAPGGATTAQSQRGARYVVQAGDTLSSIAQRHYGTSSASVIRAVVHANRSTVSNPDLLKVGVELILPPLKGGVAPGAGSKPDIVRSLAPAAAPAEQQAFRWYQIQKNDRYISIAREQLGDQRRWKDIYELNRDKFPDPGKIREGVRIKIPIKGNSTETRGP